ncbi:MAG TPA: hypothetical protein VGA37_11405 [Gemmatimonadales bacterium]
MSSYDRGLDLLRRFWAPTYFFGALLILLPLIDLGANVWPLRFGDVQWRYGTAGLFAGFLLTPLIGMMIVVGTAAVMEHRHVIRILSFVNGVAAAVLVIIALSFVLDWLQMRRNTPPEAVPIQTVGALKAILKYFVVAAGMGWYAMLGLRATPAARAAADPPQRLARRTKPVTRPAEPPSDT